MNIRSGGTPMATSESTSGCEDNDDGRRLPSQAVLEPAREFQEVELSLLFHGQESVHLEDARDAHALFEALAAGAVEGRALVDGVEGPLLVQANGGLVERPVVDQVAHVVANVLAAHGGDFDDVEVLGQRLIVAARTADDRHLVSSGL